MRYSTSRWAATRCSSVAMAASVEEGENDDDDDDDELGPACGRGRQKAIMIYVATVMFCHTSDR